jgi:AraC-like DNA-binding protein
VFDGAALKPAEFSDPDTEIPYLGASRLLKSCLTATGCEHFGLLVGIRASPSTLGLAGFMLSSAADVGTALRGLVQNLDLHDQGGVPTLHVQDGVAALGYAIRQPGAQAADQIYDLAIAIACNIMRALCGESWNPTEVLLSRRSPRDLSPYRRFFRAPMHFDAGHSALAFPSRWLNHKLASADPLLHSHLENEARALQARRKAGIVEDVRRLLRKRPVGRSCTVSDVARELHLHRRTLSRRLQEQGTSFRQELDTVRFAMAQQLLAESQMSIARIATLLDYADVTAFSRAFKRWTGMPPAQWRMHNDAS